MSNHGLSRPKYEAVKREFKPLCSGCLDMNPSIFDWRAVPWATAYPRLDSQKIVIGADKQCVSCGIILAAFESVGLDLRTTHDIQQVAMYNDGKDRNLTLSASPDEASIVVELFTANDNPYSPWSIIGCSTHFSGNTASTAGLDRIRQWIHDCNTGHDRCRTQHDAALPARLLDIGKSNNSIRLVETYGLQGRYICLSHCWGTTSTTLCTAQTYGGLQENIPWSSLPLLFQNAVEICRMLDVRYLWIDKLCIIQGDENDWAREGSRMAQTFAGSFLAIGATISRDDTRSLFFEDQYRHPSLRSHVGRSQDGRSYTIYSRIPLNYHPTGNPWHKPDSKTYPLMTRGWVYQERLLAPRMLHFGEELSWECGESSVCECAGAKFGIKRDHSLSLAPSCPAEEVYLQWQKLVEDYTSLQLSHEEDRLPAFSGLAHQYEPRLGSAYLAGLWRDNLVADLMWFGEAHYRTAAQRYNTRKPVKWRAPSWSWASVEGTVQFCKDYQVSKASGDSDGTTTGVEIISVECTTTTLDPMGMVANGYLVIRGSGRSARLMHRENCEGSETRHFTYERIDKRSYREYSNYTVDGHAANVDYDLIEHGFMIPNSEMEVFRLYLAGKPVMQSVFDRAQGAYIQERFYRTWCLLLYCVDGKYFERVGFLVADDFGANQQFPENLQERVMTII